MLPWDFTAVRELWTDCEVKENDLRTMPIPANHFRLFGSRYHPVFFGFFLYKISKNCYSEFDKPDNRVYYITFEFKVFKIQYSVT